VADVSIISDTSIMPSGPEPGEATHKYDRWGSALAYALSAVLLGLALSLPELGLSPLLTALSFVVLVVGLVTPALKSLERHGDAPVAFALALALIAQVGTLLVRGFTPAMGIALASGLLLAGSNLAPVKWLGRAQVPLLLLSYVAFGFLDVAHAAKVSGPLDDGVHALLAGENPYHHTYREMPVLLLLATPARLFGDIRFGLVIATAASAACISAARPGRAGAISAALIVFLPAGLVAVEDAGVEPFLILLLAFTVFCACRFPKLFPWVLGLLLVAKTYLVLAVPIAVVLASLKFNRRDALRMGWKALLSASLVTLPFVFWDLGAFGRMLINPNPSVGASAPTFLSWLIDHGGPALPGWIGLCFAAGLVALVLGRAARTASGFAAGIALTYFGLFAFSAHAVASQYAFVLAALYISVGATGLPGVMIEAASMRSFYVQR
jgi:hypothetical protein